MIKKRVRFGVIGLGMMGREFASAAARWTHLPELDVRPEIVSICSASLKPDSVAWFRDTVPTIEQETRDYRDVLANPKVDAVYIAVPHNLHREMYVAAIEAGKHLFGEKPFGIDRDANDVINRAISAHPDLCVRCVSQFAFLPGVQAIAAMLEQNEFGEIIDVELGFQHSSDLNPEKKINWKRKLETNGAYGVMGDLGMHVLHLPLRADWRPKNCRAVLSNIIDQRPDATDELVPCETWDNATLLVETERPGQSRSFPISMRLQRIAPGETNTWYLTILGTRASARFSTKNANIVQRLYYRGGRQNWETIDLKHAVPFRSITPAIFEVGFSDTILQMWAAYLYELVHGQPFSRFTGCITPTEVALRHTPFTPALQSPSTGKVVAV